MGRVRTKTAHCFPPSDAPDTVARPSLLADTATRPSRPSIVSPIGAVTLVKATQLTPDCPRLRGLHSVWP